MHIFFSGSFSMTTRNPADLNYVCYIGESYRNGNFPKNNDKLSFFSFLSLFWRVLFDQIKSSYTLYFIIIGILEFAPDVTTVNPWMAFLPLFVAIFLDYAFQVKNLISIHKSLKAESDCKYNIIRDHRHTKLNLAIWLNSIFKVALHVIVFWFIPINLMFI